MQLLKPMDNEYSHFDATNASDSPLILVVDDEPDIRHLVQEILEDEGYKVEVAENGDTARHAYQQHQPQLILLDIWMPDIDGITLLKEWSENGNLIAPVIMMSGHGTVETAVEATRLGAFDFIEKPLSLAKLLLTIEQALSTDKNLTETTSLQIQNQRSVNEPIGHSPTMQRLREQIKRIAEHDSGVLLHGEAGSGVKVAAQFLHNQSHQCDKPFVEINLSSLSYKNHAEEIVGKGDYLGLLDKAQNGTLFLRNIDNADKETQAFLINLLQTNSFQTLNKSTSKAFKARIICSSHKNIEQLVEDKTFKKDLFYLINVVPLKIPSLRDHREDIPDLLSFYTNIMVEQDKLPYRHFSLAAQNRLRNYEWLGNIRELTNLVQHLLITATENEISLEDVEAAVDQKGIKSTPEESISITYDLPLREARERFERDYLIHQLIKTNGNISKVAKLIGMERTHLYRKLRALNINPKKILIKNDINL